LNSQAYLLDTNVISETRKTNANKGVMDFLSSADENALFMSVLTLGELRKGVAVKRRTDPIAAGLLGEWVDAIETNFADRILPVDAAAASIWGELAANRSLPVIDNLIAATAIARTLTLVTRNIKDVESSGAALLDPWI